MLNCLSLPRTTLDEIRVFLDRYAVESFGQQKASSPEVRLARMRTLLEKLGNPQHRFKAIHVAGTTGKGSTCAYSDAILRAHGQSVGLSLSPHVEDVLERFQVNGVLVDVLVLSTALELVLSVVVQLEDEDRPGYTELLRAISFLVFANVGVEYAVIETGVGGRFDSSNTLDRPDTLRVITKLGLDHQATLGTTIEEIALQKVGIVHPANEVVIGFQEDILATRIEELAYAEGAKQVLLSETSGELQPFSDLIPNYARQNASLALHVCQYLALRDGWLFSVTMAEEGVRSLQLPLRFERVVWKGKTVILDAAHNPQKMRGLVQALTEVFQTQALAVAFAFNSSTDVKETALPLLGLDARLVCVDFLGGSGDYRYYFSDPKEVVRQLSDVTFPDQLIGSLSGWEALANWIESVPEQVVILTGSFHFVANCRALLGVSAKN